MIDIRKITKSLVLSALTLLLSVTVLYAASTIGANIVTTGTLSVTDTSTLTGAVTTAGNATFGDAATDVNLFTGTLQASTTALFTGASTFYSTLTLGSSGTAHSKFISGNCAGSRPSATFAASSTEEWICSVTGVANDDKVFAALDAPSSGTINTEGFEGLVVTGARATTSNAIGVRVYNGTGAASTTFSTNYTNLNYFIAD